MASYLQELNSASEAQFQKSLRLVLNPYQQVSHHSSLAASQVNTAPHQCTVPQLIGNDVFEVCFISDPDGALIELLAQSGRLEKELAADWT